MSGPELGELELDLGCLSALPGRVSILLGLETDLLGRDSDLLGRDDDLFRCSCESPLFWTVEANLGLAGLGLGEGDLSNLCDGLS